MARNLDAALERIRGGLEDEVREELDATRNRRTGFLYESINVVIEDKNDFIINFAPYGVYLDQGTIYIEAKPFYSETLENNQDFIESVLEDAFEQDIEEMEQQLNNDINN